MKKLLLLCCVLFTYIGHCQYADNFNYIEDTWSEYLVKNNDGSYLILAQPDDAIIDFGYGKIMRFDQNFNQIGTTINFTNENADNCCSSNPRVAHFINDIEFAVYGSVRVDNSSNIYYSFAKYDNTGDTPLIDKRLVNAYCSSMVQGVNENYALFNVKDPHGASNNGTDDFSFSYDSTIGNQQVVLLAYDDNLDENWHIQFNVNSSATNGLRAREMFQTSNGDIVIELSSFGTLELNGTSYGENDMLNVFFVRVDPSTQQVIAPVLVLDQLYDKKMAEDPFNNGTFYLIDYYDVLQLDNNWNITRQHTDYTIFSDIFFTEQDVIVAKIGSVSVSTPIGLLSNSVRYFDREMNPKYDMRVFGNCMGGSNSFLFLEVKSSFVSYDNGVLESIQTYGTEHDNDPNYIPEIDGTLLPEFNGGFNTVVYNTNYIPLLQSEYNQAIQVAPASSVFNYVEKTGDGTLIPSDSHISYLVFPNSFDFSQYPLNSLVPSEWYTIPDGWGETIIPRIRYDAILDLFYFEIKSADNTLGSITAPGATKVSFLKVYLTDEQFVLSVNEEEFKNDIVIYPNPTKDLINIKGIDNIASVEIELYTIHGSLIRKVSNTKSISIELLAKGIYLLKVKHGVGEDVFKVIKR
jgi:hypothetical protein